MCSYLLQLNHVQISFRFWYPFSLLISDVAIENAIRYRYRWRYRYSPVTSTWANSRNASVVSVFSAFLFFVGGGGGAINLQRDLELVRDSELGLRYGARSLSRQIHSPSLSKNAIRTKPKYFALNQRKRRF